MMLNNSELHQISQYATQTYFVPDPWPTTQRDSAQFAMNRGKFLFFFVIISFIFLVILALLESFFIDRAFGFSGFLYIVFLTIYVSLFVNTVKKSGDKEYRSNHYRVFTLYIVVIVLLTCFSLLLIIFYPKSNVISSIVIILLILLALSPFAFFALWGWLLFRLKQHQLQLMDPLPKLLTDKEFDTWLEKRITECFVRTIRIKGLEGEITNPRQLLRIRGYVLPGMRDARHYNYRDLHSKLGVDNRWRYSINTYTYFYPAEHQIMVFRYNLNAMNWGDYYETFKEYFYEHVIGIEDEDDLDTIQVGDWKRDYRTQHISLRLSDGRNISATVHSRPIDALDLPVYDIPNTNIDRAIGQLRMLIRSKKMER